MKFKHFFLSVVITIGIVACSEETTVYNSSKNLEELEVNQEILTNSIDFDNAGVLDVFEEDKTSGKFAKNENDLAGDYPLTLVAQVKAPSFNDNTNLGATHIAVAGDYVYVSYNTPLDTYAGAIDIIKISDPHNPEVTARLNYSNADINAVTVYDGYIYVAGSVDSELSVTATENSFVAKINSANGSFNLNDITYGFQQGKAGTDVISFGSKILVTSGKMGSLSVYNSADLKMERQFEANDLLSVAKQDNYIATLAGDFGVTIYDQDFGVISEIPITTNFGVGSKKIMDFTATNILIPESGNGVGVYNFESGDQIKYLPIATHPDAEVNGDHVTNAISINEEIIMIANGASGLCLAEEKDGVIRVFGIIDIDGSANYVASKGDYAFAASGTKGLQIIKLNRPSSSLATKCTNLENYKGSSSLVVNTGEQKQYKGSKRFKSVVSSGELLLCGTWTTKENTVVEEGALFEMNGSFYIATNKKRATLYIKKNATFRVEGTLYVYGDVILEEGATLEFLGDNSVVNVLGNVQKDATAKVLGAYRDLGNKF